MVGGRRLELLYLAALVPKTSVSTISPLARIYKFIPSKALSQVSGGGLGNPPYKLFYNLEIILPSLKNLL